MALFLIILFVTIGCAVVLYLFLKGSQRLSEREKVKAVAKDMEGEIVKEDISPRVAKVLHDIQLPAREMQQTVKVFQNFVDKNVHEKTEVVRSQVSTQYRHVIEKKQKAVKRFSRKYEAAEEDIRLLGKETQQTSRVVQSLGDGVIVTDSKGEPMMMNEAAEKLLGMTKGEAAEKKALSTANESMVIAMLKQTGEQGEKEIELKGGTEETKKTLRASRAVIQDENGRMIGMVSVLTDVTKEKELNDLKDQFVANVSHELRTPLHCVKESIGLLLERVLGDINDEQERLLTLAQRNILRLTRLINDLLDFSKLEAGELKLKITSFSVRELIDTIRDTFEPWATSKGVKIFVEPPEAPFQMTGDHDKLSQVLTNLVGNALKFIPDGSNITIKAEVKKTVDPSAPTVEFCVSDNGPGIPKEDQPRVFEKFTQSKTVNRSKVKGTGLGLAISKEIVELHRGKIWLESEEGKGSNFYFTVPQEKSEQKAVAA